MPWIQDDVMRLIPSLTWQVMPQVQDLVDSMPADAVIVDLGAGGRKLSPSTLCVDFIPFPGTDLVGDVERLPLATDSVDLVVATGLLEHVADDRALLNETYRILKPGGRAHFELPFMQQYHDDPIDNRRLTVPGLAREMTRAGLAPEKSGFHIGPTVAITTLFTYYAQLWFEGNNIVAKVLSNAVFLFFSIVLWPFKFLDAFLKRKKSAHRIAFGVYCTARKP